MLHLRVFTPADLVDAVERCLVEREGVRHVTRGPTASADAEHLVAAYLADAAVDVVLDDLSAHGVPHGSIFLVRLDAIEPDSFHAHAWIGTPEAPPAWAEIVAGARSNARLFGRYAIAMAAAGIIAACGVVEDNQILIVGAMAVSPDLLPLVAACVGIVGRRPLMVTRAVGTLVIGLLLAAVAAWLTTSLLELTNTVARGFQPTERGLGTLAETDTTTVIVALAAGVVGMLAFQTRGSAAVGVAISVTTIPAAAYMGVSFAVSRGSKVQGALGVLGTNLLCLLIAGSITLAVQRAIWRRTARSRSPVAL